MWHRLGTSPQKHSLCRIHSLGFYCHGDSGSATGKPADGFGFMKLEKRNCRFGNAYFVGWRRPGGPMRAHPTDTFN